MTPESIFPGEAIDILLGALRGKKDVDIGQMVLAAGKLLSYAGSQMSEGNGVTSYGAVAVTQEVMVAQLEGLASLDSKAAQAFPIPWTLITKIALKMILDRLEA